MKYQAVLFDLDGTLLNTLDDIANSMNQVLERLGYPVHPIEQYKYFVGDGMDKLVRRALPEDVAEAVVTQGKRMMLEEYGQRWCEKTKTYKGIPELLESLVGRGIKLTVLSNKPNELTNTLISKYFPHWRFKPVLGARPDIPKKPDPTVALEIASELNILPDRFLFLGDTGTDMKTAISAGMYPVGALWGFRTTEELKTSGAKALVANPMDVMKLV